MKILEFFKVKRPWDVIWAHAVNDKERLKRFCSDNTMMIEGDISLSKNGEIIMAHPPKRKSDLTFDEWIEMILKSHKGAKLDFKDPIVVIPVLRELQRMKIDIPIFLNADILRGPGGSDSVFNPSEFISNCNEFYPNADYISLGWTIGYTLTGRYTSKMVNDMISTGRESIIPVTISVLAYYMPRSWSALREIFEKSEDTITIWNVKKVKISERLKNWIRNNVDKNRTFVDLIDKKGAPIRI